MVNDGYMVVNNFRVDGGDVPTVYIYILTISPLKKLFQNTEMVVSCSIMQCSRTIFVLCTEFCRVFPQQLQFLLNKV